jgi:hypothetical protein
MFPVGGCHAPFPRPEDVDDGSRATALMQPNSCRALRTWRERGPSGVAAQRQNCAKDFFEVDFASEVSGTNKVFKTSTPLLSTIARTRIPRRILSDQHGFRCSARLLRLKNPFRSAWFPLLSTIARTRIPRRILPPVMEPLPKRRRLQAHGREVRNLTAFRRPLLPFPLRRSLRESDARAPLPREENVGLCDAFMRRRLCLPQHRSRLTRFGVLLIGRFSTWCFNYHSSPSADTQSQR